MGLISADDATAASHDTQQQSKTNHVENDAAPKNAQNRNATG